MPPNARKSKGGPAKSSAAAAFLSKNGSNAPIGFGGNTFASGFGAPTTAEAVTTSHNDPEISLWFKHLSKKDDSTKIKALNNLQSRVKDFSSEDAGEFVPPWLFSFKKLCTDNSRSVRAGAAKVLALVVQKAGKNAAPHLKELLGPLLLAMQDMYPEAGDQAVGLFEAMFSTPEKRRQALLRARKSVVQFLRTLLLSSAEDMGEPTKETNEEMQDRASRVRAQVLRTLDATVKHFPTASSQPGKASSGLKSAAGPAKDENDASGPQAPEALQASAEQMNEALKDLWMDGRFWKYPIESHPQDAVVWVAWCRLVTTLAVHQPDHVAPAAELLAPLVYGSVKQVPEHCQDAAWTTVLRFTTSCPAVLKDAAVFKQLATDVASQMKSGHVSVAMVSGLLPLGLQLVKLGPEEWNDGKLHTLWLSSMHTGFKKSASGRHGEVAGQALTELFLFLKLHAAQSEQIVASELQAESKTVLQAVVSHSHSEAFGRGLWKALSVLLGLEGKDPFNSAAQRFLQDLQAQCQQLWENDDASITQIQPLVTLLAAEASHSASSTKTSQMINTEVIKPLMHTCMATASSKQLSSAQGNVLVELAANIKSSDMSAAKGVAETATTAALSRATATGPEVDAESTDVVIVQGLLLSGLVTFSYVSQQLLSLLSSTADSQKAIELLMSSGHTVPTFTEACESVQGSMSTDQLFCVCQLLILLQQKLASDGVLADMSSELILLLCLGHLLSSSSAVCQQLMSSSAIPRMLNYSQFSDDKGLLYMISASLKASAAVSASEDILDAAGRIMPCAEHCLVADHILKQHHAETAAVEAFRTAVLPVVFEFAVHQLAGAKPAAGVSDAEKALRGQAAAAWRSCNSLITACASSDSALLPMLMSKLLTAWNADQDTNATDAEGIQLVLKQLCSSAAGYAPHVIEMLKQAQAVGGSVLSSLWDQLTKAAFNQTSTDAAGKGSDTQHMALLLLAVLLQTQDAQLLACALRDHVWQHAAQLAVFDVHRDVEPDCGLLAALLQHAAYTLPADDAGLQVCELLKQLWNELQTQGASESAKSLLNALLVAIDSVPPAASRAVADFFCAVSLEAAEKLCTGDQERAAQVCQIISTVAPQVQAGISLGRSTVTSRDAFAVKVLAWLCQQPPILSRVQQQQKASTSASAPEVPAMVAVASLYIPRQQHEHSSAGTSSATQFAQVLAGSNDATQDNGVQEEDNQHSVELQDARSTGAERNSESDDVQQSFSSTVAHQFRAARLPNTSADENLAEDDHAALQHLLLAAHSSASGKLTSTSLERLERYLEERVSRATCALEQHCEAMSGALLDATRKLANLGDDVEPKECADIALRLSWSNPGLVSSRLQGAVEKSIEETIQDSTALKDTACELICQLHKSSAAQEGGDGHSEALEHMERLAVRMLLCYGVCLHIGRVLDGHQEEPVDWAAWSPGSTQFWHAVAQVVLMHVSDGSVDQAVAEFDAWAESELGVPAAQAAVGVLQCDAGSACIHAAATRIALRPSVLSCVVKGDVAEDEQGEEEAGGDRSARQTLAVAGFDPAFSQALDVFQSLTVANCDAPLMLCCILLSSMESLPVEDKRRAALALSTCDPAPVPPLLDLIMQMLPSEDTTAQGSEVSAIVTAEQSSTWTLGQHAVSTFQGSAVADSWHTSAPAERVGHHLSAYDLSALSVGIYRDLLRCSQHSKKEGALQLLPASVRSWFSMLKSQRTSSVLQEYTTKRESPPLLHNELQVALRTTSPGMDVTASGGQREVVASIEVDDGVMLELAITLPACYPLQAAEVTVRRTVAIQEKLLRRWLLSMAGLLRSQNCSLSDALVVWKSNVDQEFAGVEPCMICYSVINPSNRSLPKMCCKTCSQTFHSLCLFKWFKSAGKSSCPHCQSPW